MIDGKWETCCRCEVRFWLSQSLYESAQALRERFEFYCPYGHSQHYVTGESEKDKLRRERDQLKQQIAQRDDEIAARDRQLVAAKGQITKARNKAAAGQCPCCRRTFANMARHMAHMHPDFKNNVVEFKAEVA